MPFLPQYLPFYLSGPPGTVTAAATVLTPVKATLHGTVDPKGLPTAYWFEYGKTEAYGSVTPKVEGLNEAASVSALIKGLDVGVTYHFRLVAENAEGLTSGEDATFKTGADPTAFRPSLKPPLELDIEVEPADGDPLRLPCDSRVASRRPRGMWFSTQRGDGFGPGGCSFSRPIFKNYPDISPLDTWRFVGRNGDVAYESRLHSSPRGNDPQQQVDVNLVGWMTYLTGRPCAPLIVDRRFSSWTPPTIEERVRQLSLLRTVFDAAVEQPDGLALKWVGEMRAGIDPVCPVYFDAGGENAVAEVYYDFDIPKTSNGGAVYSDPNAVLAFAAADDDHATGLIGVGSNLRAESGSGYLKLEAAKRWLQLVWRYANAEKAGEQGEEFSALMRTLAVYGATGLTRRPGDPGGIWLSDCMRYILQTYYPKIEWAGQDNTYPVSQAAWQDNPTEGYQLIQELNDLALWETNIWEDRRFHFHAADLTRYDWLIDTTEPGVRVLFDGPSIEDFANGIVVTFTDFAGRKQILYPPDHPELRDESDSNPANRHGEDLWTTTEVPWPCFDAEALQFGRAELAEHNRPKRPARIQIGGGYIRDAAGHWHPGWAPRCSQTIGILNHISDAPRLITATPRWDQERKVLEIAVDAPPKTMDAIVARQMRAREAANLT